MFTWYVSKAIANFEKHGVPFEEAATIFVDPKALDGDDPQHSVHERRRQRIGRSLSGRILFVVYTIRRRDHEKETVRIISARQASRKERQAYAGLAD
ncbi:MAG: BrnT family toxin [Nitrospira sp.]|nr:BrnT family toxin [Nitrospira sp.]